MQARAAYTLLLRGHSYSIPPRYEIRCLTLLKSSVWRTNSSPNEFFNFDSSPPSPSPCTWVLLFGWVGLGVGVKTLLADCGHCVLVQGKFFLPYGPLTNGRVPGSIYGYPGWPSKGVPLVRT